MHPSKHIQKTNHSTIAKVMLLIASTLATSATAQMAAGKKSSQIQRLQKMQFEDVVIESLDRKPNASRSIGVVGDIAPKQQQRLYKKKRDFRKDNFSDLEILGNTL